MKNNKSTKKKNKRRKKLFKREIVLEKLAEIGEVAVEGLLNSVWHTLSVTSAMLLPYGESYRKLKNLAYAKPHFTIDFKSKVAFWSLLSKLKREGLIAENQKGKLVISSIGKQYLEERSPIPYWFKIYRVVVNPDKNALILIVFDVPEIERIKRDWLRYQLDILGFRMLQQSVWWGNNLLPKNFIQDLEKYKILPYIHIFKVDKKGTISGFLKKIGERDLAESE